MHARYIGTCKPSFAVPKQDSQHIITPKQLAPEKYIFDVLPSSSITGIVL